MGTRVFIIPSINGVAINQQVDGSMRCFVSSVNAEIFKERLMRLLEEIASFQLEEVEAAKKAEIARHTLPVSRIEMLEAEIARLKAGIVPVVISSPDGVVDTNGLSVDLKGIANGVHIDEKAKAQTIVREGFGG